MKKVWVVMSNDYPDAVFSTEEKADRHVANQKVMVSSHRIYWRSYEFVLDKERA